MKQHVDWPYSTDKKRLHRTIGGAEWRRLPAADAARASIGRAGRFEVKVERRPKVQRETDVERQAKVEREAEVDHDVSVERDVVERDVSVERDAGGERQAQGQPESTGAPSRKHRQWQLPYCAFYGLQEAPFDLAPNPRFLVLAARQQEVLDNLRAALSAPTGVTLVVGEAGTGKTTLVRAALAGLTGTASRYAVVSNPTANPAELREHLAREFSLSAAAATSKPQFLTEWRRAVADRAAAGGVTGLMVDDAHNLSPELLEEIQRIGLGETTTAGPTIVLCGQPELIPRLNALPLRLLKQRVALRCRLRPLRLEETAAYISSRLRVAGGSSAAIFSPQAVIAVHEGSSGLPRIINVICDNALMKGLAAQVRPVSGAIIEAVLRDFDLMDNAAGGELIPFDPTRKTARGQVPARVALTGTALDAEVPAPFDATETAPSREAPSTPAGRHVPARPSSERVHPETPPPKTAAPAERPLFRTRPDALHKPS